MKQLSDYQWKGINPNDYSPYHNAIKSVIINGNEELWGKMEITPVQATKPLKQPFKPEVLTL